MSSLGSPNPFFIAGKKAYEIERSLRFNPTDNANLTRTSSSASTTFTYSVWIKRCTFTGYQYIFSMGNRGFAFHTSNNTFYLYDTSALNESTAVFRDPSAWYHIVVQINSGVATSYVNNVLVHNGINGGFTLTTGTNETRIGVYNSNDYDFSGYMAEINLVDGSVVAPSSFAETNPVTGQWNPKKYTGSYGTNGFYLNFSDNSGTTATTLGKDYSGNGNNFTPNNFSVSSGLGNDSFEDTPTNNFPTLNPNHAFLNGSSSTAENGNLQWNGQSNNQAGCPSTMAFPKTGKWYWEVKLLSSNSNFSFGITPATYSNTTNPANPTGSIGYAAYGSKIVSGSETASWAASFSNSDNIGAALDMDNNEIKFYKNNSLVGTISLVSGYENVEYLAWIKGDTASQLIQGAINFGGNGFVYTPPTGFKALCSANLPDPTIKLPDKHFDTLLYTGTDTSSLNNVTGLEFQPDWVWGKARNDTIGHILFDAVRGEDRQLEANITDAEVVRSSAAYRFLSNGFAVSTVGNLNNPVNYVAWNWNAGDTDGKTYTVKVVSDSGNKYRFDDFGTSAVTLDLAEGGTYIFDQSDSSNSGHPLRFSTTSNGTHGGGTEYTTGVTTAGTPGSSGAYTQIVVAASAPTLYYYCSVHSGMGGQANTNSTLGSSNFDGNRQATTKVNALAGFSIVTSTSGGSSSGTYDSFGHGLGVAPNVIIFKNRDQSDNWSIYNSNFSTAYSKILQFNTIAETTSSNHWGTANPTSTTFSVNQGSVFNGSGQKLVAYCFSEVAGYSKFGSYTGNGDNDGPFVFTGFTPKWILLKCTGSTGNWVLIDTERPSGGNFINYNTLSPNLASAENSSGGTTNDILSNGFKIRGGTDRNINGQQHIYLAFAESPFKNARAR